MRTVALLAIALVALVPSLGLTTTRSPNSRAESGQTAFRCRWDSPVATDVTRNIVRGVQPPPSCGRSPISKPR